MKKFYILVAVMIFQFAHAQDSERIKSYIIEIGQVLDAYHAAAAEGDWSTYFDLMSEDGVFLGTDASERWIKNEFRAYAGTRTGWVYRTVSRNINLTPDGMSAWFDEMLDSLSYGTSRGTGVLIRTNEGWKISQYHMTFPIPSELARHVTDDIKAFEAGILRAGSYQ